MQPLSNLAIQINIPFRVVLQAQMASQRRDVFHTSFLTPPIIKEAMLAIEKLADIKAVAQGGYPQVEFNTKDWLIAYIIYLVFPHLYDLYLSRLSGAEFQLDIQTL
jgi:hypothetical protein